MRRIVATLGALCLGGCLMGGPDDGQSPSNSTAFTRAVNQALSAQDEFGRFQALAEARRLAREGDVVLSVDCLAVSELVDAAPAFEERPARATVQILTLMPCPASPDGLRSAARATWRARSGMVRATALASLARGERDGLWQTNDLGQTVALAAGDENELVRAAALSHVLATASDSDRASYLAEIGNDPSPLVRRLVAVRSSGEQANAQP